MRCKFHPLVLALMLSLSGGALASNAKPPVRKGGTPEKAPAVTEITFSHQLARSNAERLAALVERFNSQHKDVRINLVHAEAHGKPAHLNLATTDTVANFVVNQASFKPLHQLMKETREPLAPRDLSTDLWVGESKNKPVALPVAFSTPVLFYNKRIFRKAGLDPEQPPRTWRQMQDMAGVMVERGIACPYTSSWPVWVHIDNVSSVSGVPVADKKGELGFNGLPQVKHVAMLATWHKAGYFHNVGRTNEADEYFHKNECAMLTSDAWAASYLREAPGVELGVAPLPYHEDIYGGPRHTLAGGASIWIGGGYKPHEYKAVARFVRFILAPETQMDLARVGGFLPLTDTARKALKAQLPKDEEQVLDVAYASLQGKGAAQPLRISTLEPVRMIVDEELEQVWADKKPAKAALDTAVSRGNSVLAAKPALKKVVAF